MFFLNGSNTFELISNFIEAFFAGFNRHTFIHVGPLEILTISSIFKICHGVAHFPSIKILVPEFSMFLLVGSRFFKDLANLYVTIFLSFRSEVSVLVTCLRFTCKSLLQISLCFCSF